MLIKFPGDPQGIMPIEPPKPFIALDIPEGKLKPVPPAHAGFTAARSCAGNPYPGMLAAFVQSCSPVDAETLYIVSIGSAPIKGGSSPCAPIPKPPIVRLQISPKFPPSADP